ncbi:serine hydrolase [Cobetia marina]
MTVLDTADGRRVSWRGDQRFPMSSTFKVLGCGKLRSLVDARQESLSRKVEIRPVDLATSPPSPNVRWRAMVLYLRCCAAPPSPPATIPPAT